MTITVKAGTRGVDFSFAKPPAQRLIELGYEYVVGYISVPPASPAKNLSKAQCDDYIAAGLKVLVVWEMDAARPNKGATYGAIDGKSAAQRAAALGYPTDVPILSAADLNSFSGNIDQHEAYMRAFEANCGPWPMGIYGDTDILARTAGIWRIGWVPLGAWAWSGTSYKDALAKSKAVGAHVLQSKGFHIDNLWAVDPNDTIIDFPAWGTATIPELPDVTDPVIVTPPPEEVDMKAILYTVTGPVGGAWFYVSPERNVSTLGTAAEHDHLVAAGALERDVTADDFRLQLPTMQPVGALTVPAQNVLGAEATADWDARAAVARSASPAGLLPNGRLETTLVWDQ